MSVASGGSTPTELKSSQEVLLKYTEQERRLICPEGVCVRAVFQQPELRMMLVLFSELFLCFESQKFCAAL